MRNLKEKEKPPSLAKMTAKKAPLDAGPKSREETPSRSESNIPQVALLMVANIPHLTKISTCKSQIRLNT
jgi:hypothetical protein